MRSLICKHLFLLLFFFYSSAQITAQSKDILLGASLSKGYDMGVNASSGRTDWLKREDGYFKASDPAYQSWGVVFITVGHPIQPPRPVEDFSAFNAFTVDLKGESGNERIEIGIKTNVQPDDGSETKIPVTLTSEWKSYNFSLDRFVGVNPKKLYVVFELVFSGADAQTVYFRNITYIGLD